MFNRQPFNRGKFNVSSSLSLGSNGIGLMVMDYKPILSSKIISSNGTASMKLGNKIDGTIIKLSKGTASMVLGSMGEGTKVFIVPSDISGMVMSSEANQTLAGESMIMLEKLNLKPGDELVINNCDMTVTINGQNAMRYFSSESEFFSFLNGINEIIYSDTNSTREISFDVIWKDRWL